MASQKSCDVLGIADGVGGWREIGVDPSIFSSNLMKQCKRMVDLEQKAFSDTQNINTKTPLTILSGAYDSLVESKDPKLVGSSTACLLVFNRDTRRVYAANLGDSGFVVVRNNQVIHRSDEQYHYFNCPFQLSLVPSEMNTGSWVTDKPEHASISSVQLAEGDFIVTATDGLWDNLSEGQLLLKLTKVKVGDLKLFSRLRN